MFIVLDKTISAKVWLSKSGLSANHEEIIKNWKLTYDLRKSEIQCSDIMKCNLSDILTPGLYYVAQKDIF
jgi:hypothetical protein